MIKTFGVNRAKAIGIVFSIVGLILTVLFAAQINFSIRLESWFNQEYWVQFMPLATGVLLLFAGVFTFFERPSANFTLALFGHTTSEEIIFNWLGLTSTSTKFFDWLGLSTSSFSGYVVVWFFPDRLMGCL